MISSENRHPPSPSQGHAFRDHALTVSTEIFSPKRLYPRDREHVGIGFPEPPAAVDRSPKYLCIGRMKATRNIALPRRLRRACQNGDAALTQTVASVGRRHGAPWRCFSADLIIEGAPVHADCQTIAWP